jgi:hypothetical protein
MKKNLPAKVATAIKSAGFVLVDRNSPLDKKDMARLYRNGVLATTFIKDVTLNFWPRCPEDIEAAKEKIKSAIASVGYYHVDALEGQDHLTFRPV